MFQIQDYGRSKKQIIDDSASQPSCGDRYGMRISDLGCHVAAWGFSCPVFAFDISLMSGIVDLGGRGEGGRKHHAVNV